MKPVFNKRDLEEGRRRLALFSVFRTIGAAVLVLLGISFAAWPTQPALTMTTEAGQLVHAVPVQPGSTFTIRFIHSVHRTPVEEHFRISEDWFMILERVVYESYGVGNPSGVEEGEQFYIDEGRMVIEGMERSWKTLYQRIGQKGANHELIVGEQAAPFASWSEPGSRVLLEVKRVSRWSLWKQRRGGGKDESGNERTAIPI